MTHLRDTEFVDFAEGTLAPPRAAHLDTCAECRTQAEAISAALREAASADVPEPSPLFWDHFSARVREGIAGETPERAGWWTTTGIRVLMPLIAALAVVIGIVSAALLPRWMQATPPDAALARSHAPAASGSVVGEPTAEPDLDTTPAVDAKNAAVWDVLTAAASDMAIDDAHAEGMGIRPGAVDHAVHHMNQAELTELRRLLKTELKQSSD